MPDLKFSSVLAGALALSAAVVLPVPSATAQNSAVCDGYARDFADRNSRGHVSRGAGRGAIGGGIIGGIAGGGKGAGIGALVGGGAGAIVGGERKSRDYNALYNQAYANCMRR